MTNSLNKDDDLLILSSDNSIDFGSDSSEVKKDNDDFSFTLIDESPVNKEVSSTKSELSDLLSSTSSAKDDTKNELADLGNILNISPEEKEEKKDSSSLGLSEDFLILDSEENKEEKKESNDSDFSDVLIETKEEKIEKKSDLLTSEEAKKEENFEDKEKEIKEFLTEEKNKDNINSIDNQDISEILAGTISQFEKRQNIISEEIFKLETHIKELEEALEEERKYLDRTLLEKEAITKNKTAIEKMKNDYESPVLESKTPRKSSK